MAVASLVLIWRNRWPAAVLAVSTAAVLGYTLLGYVNGAALLAPAAAVYAVATKVSVRQALVRRARRWPSCWRRPRPGTRSEPRPAARWSSSLSLMAAACLGGIAVSNRRAFVASIKARAEDEARMRIDEERLRIARELHDVVAHTMSTINVQASAAATVLTDRPDAAAEALQAIRTASKNGLRELRAILNVLRQADDADPTAPAPGLAQLDALDRRREPGRPADHADRDRPGGSAARGRRPRRLPDHPGVADERDQARGPRHRDGRADLSRRQGC